MLSQAQVDTFRSKGFLLGERVLDDAEVDVLRSELARVIEERNDASKPQPVLARNIAREPAVIWQIVNIWEASEAFRELIYHPRVVEEIAQLTGNPDELRVWHDQIQYKPAGEGGVNMWHQDSPYWPILQPKTSQVTAWIALDDVDESNGCMSMVPGSYQWGDQIGFIHTIKKYDEIPTEFDGKKVLPERCPVPKGHVHYHHALTWHGSHANTSGNPRRAIAVHYMTGETRYDAKGGHVMKPFATVADGEKLSGDHFPLVLKDGKPIKRG